MDFKLPDIGEGVHEGEITKWLVKSGEPISADQPMVEVMTDKATVEIPSPVTGVVEELFAKEGETVPVGKAILRIKENGGKSTKPQQASAPSRPPTPAEPVRERAPVESAPAPVRTPQAPAPSAPRPSREEEVLPYEILATPATRKLARDLDINLREVKGTGPHGRITKTDVQLHYEGTQASQPRPSHTTAVGVPAVQVTAPAAAKVPVVSRGEVQRIPLRGLRKKIADAMTVSKRTAAHFTYVEEVDMTAVVRLRAEAQEEAKKRNVKLTYLPFIIKALVPALQEFPMLNASLDDERQEIVVKGDYNIGIATDTPNGLIVPVVKGVDRKSVWELAAEISELAEKVRANKIAVEDLRGGTFTITSIGSIGGVFATPIINYPEVAILGVNAIRKRPVVQDDQIVIREMMYLSMSVDHRVVDGAGAARFMNRLIYFLSEPTRLVFA